MKWTEVCNLAEIQIGDMKEFEVGDAIVLVLRTTDGAQVIPPHCPHMDECLINGVFDGETLTCTKHLWQWQVSPWNGPMTSETELDLARYCTKTVEGKLSVDIETGPVRDAG